MSWTARPASRSAFAVPPVETSSTPWRGERPAELDQAALVGDGQQRAADGIVIAMREVWTGPAGDSCAQSAS